MARFEKGDQVFEITSADARYAVEQRRLLREGWRRVPDPRCDVPLGAEPIEPTLEAALRADPTDTGAALVYADWLQQQGHPRGALIATQHRLAASPRDQQLAVAEQELVDDAGEALISRTLRAHLAIERAGNVVTALSSNLFDGGTLVFDHGFIRTARLLLKQRGGDEDLLWDLLRHPSARVLAELDLTLDLTRDRELVAALLVHGPHPPLRTLRFRATRRDGVVDLRGLAAAYPDLVDLELAITRVWLHALDLPRLRRLVVLAERSDVGRLLAEGVWPELAHLELAGPPDDYRLALEAPRFPQLRVLGLHRPHPDDNRDRDGIVLCRMLVRSPLAAQLERLELHDIDLAPEAIASLVEHRAAFDRLVGFHVDPHRGARVLGPLREAGYPIP